MHTTFVTINDISLSSLPLAVGPKFLLTTTPISHSAHHYRQTDTARPVGDTQTAYKQSDMSQQST